MANQHQRQRQRKGIILLAIISLLTMFMLIGVTYVVVSGHFKRSAISNAQSRQLGVTPQKHLDSAMYQLVRDTDRAGSIARGHSLLQDKYGHFSVRARVNQAVYGAGRQILELRIEIDPEELLAGKRRTILPTPLTFATQPQPQGLAMLSLGALNGRVVTFIDGGAKNVSGRIIKSSPHIVDAGTSYTDVPWNYTIRLLFPKGINNSIAPSSFEDKLLVINGRDFSGTGAALVPPTNILLSNNFDDDYDGVIDESDESLTSNLIDDDHDNNIDDPDESSGGHLSTHSLLPNRSNDTRDLYNNAYRFGGLNEGYDVPDYQNMAVAALINNPTDRRLEYVIPSFHRPALFNYWVNARNSDTPLPYNLTWHQTLQRILMRPMPWDNPEFTGSNPRMSLGAILVDGAPGNHGDDDDGNGYTDFILDVNGNGTYDPGDVIDSEELFFPATNDNLLAVTGFTLDQVDNDNDGVVNNIEENHFPWDIDNDGDGTPDSIWVDLGLPVQTDESGRKFKPLFAILCTDMDGRLNLNAHGNQMQYLAAATNTPVATASGDTSTSPRGLGFGPAEINLGSILPNVKQYSQLLMGGQNQINGRYGSNLSVGALGIDFFSGYIFNDYPRTYQDQRDSASQTIIDLHGELGRGINTAGNLVSEISGVPAATPSNLSQYISQPSGNRHTIADNPYELNLVSPKATDAIFTPQELELILRVQDTDNSFQPDPGADQAWGHQGVDDDGNGFIDDIQEALTPGSDDRFIGQINSRLVDLTSAFTRSFYQNGEANRRSVTTDSFDAPTPSVQIPKALRNSVVYGDGGHAVQLLRAKMAQDQAIQNQVGGYPPVLREFALNLFMSWSKGADGGWGVKGEDDNNNNETDEILEAGFPGSDDTRSPLLDIAIFDGQKMDVNRPFGNGMDDPINGIKDGVVDNFIESTVAENLWPNIFNGTPVFVDHDNDGISGPAVADGDAFLARYHYARQLYVLTMLVNERPEIDFNLNGSIEDYSDDGVPDETQYNIAQWAVNAVDFRDADAIMTPFEFDLNPFNGWDVDGIIGTADDAHPDRELVWGCERPELLISESIVFHDRRTEDGWQNENGQDEQTMANMEDTNYDQRLLPRSGAFFELYNPWFNPTSDAAAPASGSWAPGEFYYDKAAENFTDGVRLNQATFYPNQEGDYSPVFRLIVVKDNIKTNDEDETLLDPDRFTTRHYPSIERAIYFTDNTAVKIPTGVAAGNGHEQFFTTFEPRPLRGGHYAMIGSSGHYVNNKRYTTFIGRSADAQSGGGQAQLDYPNTRRIELMPEAPTVQALIHDNGKDVNGNPRSGYDDKTNTAIDPEIPVIGLPINQHIYKGNPSPLSLTLTEPVGGYTDDLGQPLATRVGLDGEPELINVLNIPLDHQNARFDEVGADVTESEFDRLAVCQSGTTRRGFARVHLQRLANPLQPYHPEFNPYRTIDSHQVDVTAFNGVQKENQNDDSLDPDGSYQFYSRQRGDYDRFGIGNDLNNLWKPEIDANPVPGMITNEDGLNASQIFRHDLRTTLGYLNNSYGSPQFNGTPTPENSFPSLLWNNRPFVSSLELMQVPYSKSSRLLFDYTFDRHATGDIANPYAFDNERPQTEYGHLLNFFESGDDATNFQRIFDYLHTPSPFAGAYTYLNPLLFGSGFGTDELHPPFNKVSNFRDPGKMNINTIFDPFVYAGLMNDHAGPTYMDWIDSRRGYGAAGGNLISFNPNMPSFFTNPIRPAGSGDIVPLPIRPDETDESTRRETRPDVELSLLRKKQGGNQLLFNTGYTDRAKDTKRNSTFKYQSAQRLDNLVTGRSNVYAVWITMGYFEIIGAPPTSVNPDGYQLGQEIGNDRGEIRRHRAFYMIDRSIPAAFEPGENHNVDKTVILRRYID